MKKLSSLDEYYFNIVKEYVNIDDFINILREFDKYEDTYMKFIPYDVFDIINVIKEIEFRNPLFEGLHLVLITSIIELLTTWVEHISFHDWYAQNEEKYKNRKCMRAWNDYISIHGKRKNFRSFFVDLERDEKFVLLQLIKRKYEEYGEMRYFCYQGEQCNYDNFYCNYEIMKRYCPAYDDDKILNGGIKQLANHLYDFRSKFIHEARFPRFASDPPSDMKITSNRNIANLKTSIWYLFKINNKYEVFISELYVKDFFKLVMKYLMKMMRKYLDKVS